MNQKEKDFLEVCKMLTHLAVLKNHKTEEKQIALMAKFLLTEISCDDISKTCSFLAKRKELFPDVACFFNIIAPMKSIEELAEEEISQLLEYICQGRDNFKQSGKSLSEYQRDLLSVWSWTTLMNMNQPDFAKTRLNMTFYLKSKLNSDGKTKLLLSKQAFITYQKELEQLQETTNGERRDIAI